MVDVFNGETILPGQDAWFINGSSFTLSCAVAVGSDSCAFAISLQGSHHDPFDRYSRFYRYDNGRWLCVEVQASIRSMLLHREPHWSRDGLVVLDRDGKVWFIGDDSVEQDIDDVIQETYGPLTKLVKVGEKLYMLGEDGQVYNRDHGDWRHDDEGVLEVEPTLPRARAHDCGRAARLTDMAGVPGHDEYVCGSAYIARPALFWRPAGNKWRWLGLDPSNKDFDQINLTGAYPESKDVVWLATNKGYVLKGNGHVGFGVATNTVYLGGRRKPVRFNGFAAFKGSLYVGGGQVCRVSNTGELEPQFGPLYADMQRPSVIDTSIYGTLGVADGVLWAIGNGVLSRFDGIRWNRVAMPSLYRN